MSCRGVVNEGEGKGKCKEIYEQSSHNLSSSSLKSQTNKFHLLTLYEWLRLLLCNLHQVLLGTKLSLLFPLVPVAILLDQFHLGNVWVFIISLLGLAPLAERLGFITEQIAFYTGPTVGGLLNATCGNATEVIIAVIALWHGKNNVVKYSLLGSVLSNLLLVLGTSLLCGGLAHMKKEQKFNTTASGINCSLLMMASLSLMLPLAFKHSFIHGDATVSVLKLSRFTSVIMLLAYGAYLFFQLSTHRQVFDEGQETEDEEEEEEPCIGLISSIIWLCAITVVISVLSQFVVVTIEDVAESWGISVSFISIILLPIVGNAAEHAGAVLCALKNKLDISLGIAVGSATQISMFVIPFITVVAWIRDIYMDLDFHLLDTLILFATVLITAGVLQDGNSNYMKGIVLLLCYFIIAACFFLLQTPLTNGGVDHGDTEHEEVVIREIL
ncbi:vacuolar cation/proton exchanger 3 isoform X2 [Cryptomeria japonica]|uniref:vacuolar cation/proton exchanger 3 isoform X2 n=1 Tax=Cryptomeria japonica TaxID=3369 RepID=UPI0025AC8FF8|nr:vacuolar cation/proton exchanger 3 isoform X2 [Cryptomeria japonica]